MRPFRDEEAGHDGDPSPGPTLIGRRLNAALTFFHLPLVLSGQTSAS